MENTAEKNQNWKTFIDKKITPFLYIGTFIVIAGCLSFFLMLVVMYLENLESLF